MSTSLSPALPGAHPPDTPDNHAALAGEVRSLGQTMAGLAESKHAERLGQMMRRPGWTTRQEAQLVGAMVGHLREQLAGLHRAHDALLSVTDQIGRP